MVQLHSASGDWFGDSPESLGVLPGAAGACVTSCPCTAACTGPGANSCSLQPWAATGGAAQGESSCDTSGELALTVVVEEFSGCSGYLRKE